MFHLIGKIFNETNKYYPLQHLHQFQSKDILYLLFYDEALNNLESKRKEKLQDR
jgi:hypothetical protein